MNGPGSLTKWDVFDRTPVALRAWRVNTGGEAAEGDGWTAVRWSDLRYCWRTADANGTIACALWFGDVFGPDGRALTQEVTVGAWKQTRAAPR